MSNIFSNAGVVGMSQFAETLLSSPSIHPGGLKLTRRPTRAAARSIPSRTLPPTTRAASAPVPAAPPLPSPLPTTTPPSRPQKRKPSKALGAVMTNNPSRSPVAAALRKSPPRRTLAAVRTRKRPSPLASVAQRAPSALRSARAKPTLAAARASQVPQRATTKTLWKSSFTAPMMKEKTAMQRRASPLARGNCGATAPPAAPSRKRRPPLMSKKMISTATPRIRSLALGMVRCGAVAGGLPLGRRQRLGGSSAAVARPSPRHP